MDHGQIGVLGGAADRSQSGRSVHVDGDPIGNAVVAGAGTQGEERLTVFVGPQGVTGRCRCIEESLGGSVGVA